MFEGLLQNIVLKAKARTGVSQELMIWLIVALSMSAVAIVFVSVAAFVWLEGLYGGAIAGLIVGGFHALVALAAALRIVALKRRNTQLAIAEMKAAEKNASWWSDPAVLAVGYEVAKLIGWRKLTPIVAAGALAAALGLGRNSESRPSTRHNGAHHAR